MHSRLKLTYMKQMDCELLHCSFQKATVSRKSATLFVPVMPVTSPKRWLIFELFHSYTFLLAIVVLAIGLCLSDVRVGLRPFVTSQYLPYSVL